MSKWREYTGDFPPPLYLDGQQVYIPVIVRFEDGSEAEDWLFDSGLCMYCPKSNEWARGCPPVAWRYKFESRDALIAALRSLKNEGKRIGEDGAHRREGAHGGLPAQNGDAV